MASKTIPVLLPEAPKESAVARLLIAPITFVSFLISLAIIDSRNASFRQHVHAPSHSSATDTIFGRIKNTLHSWAYRPQPYAYVNSLDILQRQKSGEIVNERVIREEPWHWNTKQKKMMKMEVADAFEMRKWIVVAIAVVVAMFAALVGLVVRRGYSFLISYM